LLQSIPLLALLLLLSGAGQLPRTGMLLRTFFLM
jgi:hypothetical protein